MAAVAGCQGGGDSTGGIRTKHFATIEEARAYWFGWEDALMAVRSMLNDKGKLSDQQLWSVQEDASNLLQEEGERIADLSTQNKELWELQLIAMELEETESRDGEMFEK